MRTPKEIAEQMLNDSPERKEAEKMMGKDFSEMEPEERVTAATVLSAFDGQWQDCKDRTHYWDDDWERLREIQRKEGLL